jgi:hypothetical protein
MALAVLRALRCEMGRPDRKNAVAASRMHQRSTGRPSISRKPRPFNHFARDPRLELGRASGSGKSVGLDGGDVGCARASAWWPRLDLGDFGGAEWASASRSRLAIAGAVPRPPRRSALEEARTTAQVSHGKAWREQVDVAARQS